MARILRNEIRILLVLGCAVCATAYASMVEGRKDNDSAVLQAALAPLASRLGDKYLIVASEPRAAGLGPEWLRVRLAAAEKSEVLPKLDQILRDYEVRNSKEHLPTDLGALNIRFVGARELATMFAGDVLGGWKRFWVEFPTAGALLDLSLPGYSSDKQWAIVCYSVSRGSLAGEIWVALLRQKGGSWVVEWSEILVQS